MHPHVQTLKDGQTRVKARVATPLAKAITANKLALRALSAVSSLILLGSLLSSPATSQEVIVNNQTQAATTTSTQTLDVVENVGLLSVVTDSVGNSLSGGNETVNATVTSTQSVTANVDALGTINGVNTGNPRLSLGTPVAMSSQSIANYGAMTTTNASSTNTVSQSMTGGHVYADAQVNSANNSIYTSAEVRSTAVANQQQYAGSSGHITGSVTQTSNAYTRGRVGAVVHYSPSPNLYESNATGNYVSSNTTSASSQDLTTTQTANNTTQSYTSINGGNMWEFAGTSNAAGNVVALSNAGGSLVATNDQANHGNVLSQAVVTGYDYGTATSEAIGVGNSFFAGNNDVYVDVDNNQLNDGVGGVVATASFDGQTGYDAYITADATGNSALAYACATCQANMSVLNNQVNTTGVTATATVNINGQGRSTVSTARATGNSATFYVSGRP